MPEVALDKLRLGGWSDWPPPEREAIEAILMAMFEDALTDPEPFAFHIDELLCGPARAGLPLAPYLARLETPGHETALQAVVARCWDGKLGRLVAEAGNFWEDAPQGVECHDGVSGRPRGTGNGLGGRGIPADGPIP